MFQNKYNEVLVFMAVTATGFACSHGPLVSKFPDTANPSEEVSKLDTDMNIAIGDQINVLSPHHFKEAQESLKEAKRSLNGQRSAKETLNSVAEGRSYLNETRESVRVSHANIEEVIVARQRAILARAPDFFSLDFSKTDEDLQSVTSSIEKNRLSDALENQTPFS